MREDFGQLIVASHFYQGQRCCGANGYAGLTAIAAVTANKFSRSARDKINAAGGSATEL